jgi:REP element-mobilizing transposase RayT
MPFSYMAATKAKADRGDAQLGFRFRKDKNGQNRGGARVGAGRKRGARPAIRHRPRARVRAGTPVHISLRIRPDAAGLRRRKQHQAIRAVMRKTGLKVGFRICQYSIQGNHLHLICEATDERTLARGVQGFSSLAARRINRILGRRGKVFADRYHCHALTTPREVRNALCYVLNNWRRHEEDRGTWWRTDPFSSADAFDGWTIGAVEPPSQRDGPAPVAPAESWLLTTGWRQYHPLISPTEVPGPTAREAVPDFEAFTEGYPV